MKEIKTQKLEIGSSDMPEGITIYDEATKQPACVKLIGGVLQAISGKCGE